MPEALPSKLCFCTDDLPNFSRTRQSASLLHAPDSNGTKPSGSWQNRMEDAKKDDDLRSHFHEPWCECELDESHFSGIEACFAFAYSSGVAVK
jgi:hypothetical protein